MKKRQGPNFEVRTKVWTKGGDTYPERTPGILRESDRVSDRKKEAIGSRLSAGGCLLVAMCSLLSQGQEHVLQGRLGGLHLTDL